MPLDPGLHRPRATPDRPGRRLLQGERIPHQEKVFSIFEPTRWISKGKAGRPVELGVAVCVVEDQYQFILHHKLLWRRRGGRGADDRGDPSAVTDLRSFGAFASDSTTGELNALPGKGRRNRAAREREVGDRGPETGIRFMVRRSTRWSIAVSTGSAATDSRKHGCAVGAGGEPAPPGAAPATAGAGRQATTQTTRRLIGGGFASAFEPAEETGTAPALRGRSTTNHPTQPIAGIFLDEIGLQLAD